eukprot:3506-Chlamydomonas_euryale.AAC.2
MRGSAQRGEVANEGQRTMRGGVRSGEVYNEGRCSIRGSVQRGGVSDEGECTTRGKTWAEVMAHGSAGASHLQHDADGDACAAGQPSRRQA